MNFKPQRLFLIMVVLLQAALLVFNAWMTSPTMNEPGHLVAGLCHWKTGSFDLYRVNPPLVRSIAALPVLMQENLMQENQKYFSFFETQPVVGGIGSRPISMLSLDFVRANGADTMRWLQLARLMIVPLTCLGTLLCYSWARDLYGTRAGLAAATMWAFLPMVLGHGCLITADVSSATMGLLACFVFWHWLRNPTWDGSVLLGGALGLAMLTKFTLLVLYPLLPILFLVHSFAQRSLYWRQQAGMLALSFTISVGIIHVGYLGEHVFRRLGDFDFVSQILGGSELEHGRYGNRFAGTFLAKLPIPLPANFLEGIDVQQRDFEKLTWSNYLMGVSRTDGWYSYYGWCLLLKSTVAFLVLISLRITARWWMRDRPWRWIDTLIVLSPAVTIFVLASLKTGMNQHGRYIIPCLPFLCIWISGLLATSPEKEKKEDLRLWASSNILFFGLLVLHVVESLVVYPHSIGFFNACAGGPKAGPKWLLGSNVDWGQDFIWLQHWRSANPDTAGLRTYHAIGCERNTLDILDDSFQGYPMVQGDQPIEIDEAATYAISINHLFDDLVTIVNRQGSPAELNQRPLAALRAMEPVGWAGYSIRVFSAEQMRRASSILDRTESSSLP